MNGEPIRLHQPWRADIQGLRAIAVLGVLFFHLDLWPFRGGFVGVDIFFVISGYLISQGIFVQLAKGQFSLRRFYERRARRILPVFVVTVIGTTILAYAVLAPPELVAYAKTLIACSAFAANIFFYLTHNYFSPSADTIPLLHLWSLGVEEQFYLLFPLFALAGASLATNWLRIAIVVVGLLSFGLSAGLTHFHPTAAFYLLPFRAFEFLIGSYLALPTTRPPCRGALAEFAAATGLGALAYSVFLLQASAEFPGAIAGVPCFGAGLLIWAGTQGATWPTKLLSTRSIRNIGNISYSLYMVHWPVIVAVDQQWPRMLPVWRALLVIVSSILLSVGLFYAVERPVRHARAFRGPALAVTSAISLVVMAAVGFGFIRAAGFPERVEARVAYYLSYLAYEPTGMTRSRKCFLEVEQSPAKYDAESCLPEVPLGKLVVLWGDSIAAHLYVGLSEALALHGFVLGQATASACPSALDYDAPKRPFCRPFNERALALIQDRRPALVILAGGWGDPDSLSHVQDTIAKLRSASIPVIVIGPAPYYLDAVPKILARRLSDGTRGNSVQTELQNFVPMREGWAKTLAEQAHVPFVSMLQAYCPASECPLVTEAGVPIEFDPLHFTLEGSRYVAGKIIQPILQNLAK